MPIKMKVCNAGDYNQFLKARGKIFSLFDEAKRVWLQKNIKKRKSKFLYSNRLIEISAVFRYLFKYPYRQLQGLLEDYKTSNKLDLPIPDYSTLCRRMAKLSVAIKDHRKQKDNNPIDITIDSTGINIYHTGGGHSKENGNARQFHGYDQVRKMHVAVDIKTKEALSMKMTHGKESDGKIAPQLLGDISCSIRSVYADAAYDKSTVREACLKKQATQIIPPNKRARLRMEKENEGPHLWDDRNAAIKMICGYSDREEGLKHWKATHSYGKRSYVEAFFSRFKRNFGFHLMSKNEKARQSELAIKVRMLNDYTKIGMAKFKAA